MAWDTVTGTGDVTGPASATANAIAVFNGITGKIIKDSGVTFPIGFSNGGTGQTTQQAALNALAVTVTSGQYLRGNGTNVVMSAIQAGDVPTLNQNTTGTAAGLSSTLVIASGGTNGTATPTAGAVAYGTGTAYAFTAAGTAGQILQSNGASAPSWVNTPAASLTVGSSAISLGTIGRVLFQGTGNVLQQSANLFWDNTNGRLAIGGSSSPSGLLQIAAGTASIPQLIFTPTTATPTGTTAGTFAETLAGVASTDVWYPQAEWNGDVCDGSNSTSNKSGYNLDPSK
jgi:hypothetical protein